MKKLVVRSTVMALLAATGVVASAGQASAVDLLADPAKTSNKQTVRSATDPLNRFTVELRSGDYNGDQYGWGRVFTSRDDVILVFEVDLDGNRSDAEFSEYRRIPEHRTYSSGYKTISSSKRAFRACVVPNREWDCSDVTVKTAWW